MNVECFVAQSSDATPIVLVQEKDVDAYLETQPAGVRSWVLACGFTGAADSYVLIPAEDGRIERVLAGVGSAVTVWSAAFLPAVLPTGLYSLDLAHLRGAHDGTYGMLSLGWGLATYRFEAFKKNDSARDVKLALPDVVDGELLREMTNAIFLVRDLINQPANHMLPSHLAEAAKQVAQRFGAEFSVIVGDDLLIRNYPSVHAVGRASVDAPRLVDMRWGNETHPKVTLVGKGVCFDSGGLDIKGADNMKLMKKDMGGAAHVLGLAQLIMATKLPVRLRVLIPAVENSVSGNAFRPLDVLPTRKGLTVEIGNTDAEGRVILSDALYEAATEHPDLLIDCATLTGAARVALGTEMPAFFTPDDDVSAQLMAASNEQADPLWRLPLFAGYEEQLKSSVAHLNNAPSSGYAGAITAALFLKKFVEDVTAWVHIDMMAWNIKARAGRPEGGEAMGLRALYAMIAARYAA